MAPPDHPWYQIVFDGSLDQGDLLDDCPIIVPKDYGPIIEAVRRDTYEQMPPIDSHGVLYNLVVLTQTCDFANPKMSLRTVTCCGRYARIPFLKDNPEWKSNNRQGNLLAGKVHGLQVLQDWQEQNLDYQVVDLRETISLPVELAQALAQRSTPHLRLKSPYREDLAQRFGICFGRIGLEPTLDAKRF